MRYAEVCTGIGGLSLGLEAMGFEPAWFAEIDPHASAVLAKRWPDVPNIGDWTRWTPTRDRIVHLLAGGIPCQSHSHAGKRLGSEDERNLWPAFRSLVEALQPTICLVENVPGMLTSDDGLFFLGMLQDFGRLCYAVEWDHVPACAVGAPHRRDRVFVVARRDGLQTWPEDGSLVAEQVELFPTKRRWPRAGRWDARGRLWEREARWPVTKSEVWPTPRTGDAKQGPSSAAKRAAAGSGDVMLDDATGARGRLNPDWVEALQGFPLGWTDLECEEPREPGGECETCGPSEWPAGEWPTPATTADTRGNAHDPHRYRGPGRKPTADNLAAAVAVAAWPAPPGDHQHSWEPPRVTERKDQRTKRLRACGNAVVPAVAEVIARAILQSAREPVEDEP